MKKKNDYAVFGYPISHSLSPIIYSLFAAETGLSYSYVRILASLHNFEEVLRRFFAKGGLGVNITLPFKERAYSLCDQVTKYSIVTKTVNTIKKLPNGKLLGDTTDGLGFINDLKRLIQLDQDSQVLLVGAGGAAQSIIPSLLTCGCQIVLTNRTFSRAKKLVDLYNYSKKITALPIESLKKPIFDLIVNMTSAGIYGCIPALSVSLITSSVACYDIFYRQQGETPFIAWSRINGASRFSDGLGMLVEQAALSFLLWHDVLPSVLPVLKILRTKPNDIIFSSVDQMSKCTN